MWNKLCITLIFSLLTSLVTAQKSLGLEEVKLKWESATTLFDKRNYTEAQRLFEQIVKSENFSETQKLDAQFYIGICALRLQQPNNYSVNYLEDFSDKNPNHAKSDMAIYEIANHYYLARKFKEATEFYNRLDLNDFPTELRNDGRFQMAYSFFELKDYDQAETNFDRIKNQKSDKYKYAANYYSGYIKFKKQKYEEALEDFKVAGENESYALAVPVMISNIYYKLGKMDELIAYSEPIAASKSAITNKSEVLGLLGEAYYEKGDYAKAVKWYGEYLQIQKNTIVDVHFKYGHAAYLTKDYKIASEQLKIVAGSDSLITQTAAYYLGNSYLKLKEFQFAQNAFYQARSARFDEKITQLAWYNEGKIHYENKNYAAAATDLQEFAKAYPKFSDIVEVRNLISESFLNGNDYKSALIFLESLEQGLTKRQKVVYQRVSHQQGINFFNTGSYENAIQYFDKSMSARSDDELYLESLYWKAESYSSLEKWNDAINVYSLIFTNDTKKSKIYHNSFYGIGYAYFNTQQYDKAKKKFEEYINSGSTNTKSVFYSSALTRLGDCLMNERKFSEARSKYKQVRDIKATQSSYATYMSGLSFYYENNLKEASILFKEVVEKYPNDILFEKSLFQYGYISLLQSDFSWAQKSFTRLIKDKPLSRLLPEAYYFRGKAYLADTNYKAAVKDFDYVIANFCRSSLDGKNSLAKEALGELESLSKNGTMSSDEYLTRLNKVGACVPDLDVEFKRLELAKGKYYEGNIEEAIKSLEVFLKEYPQTKYELDVEFLLGEGYFNLEDYKLSKSYLNQIVENAPNNFYNEATYYLAQMAEQEKDYVNMKKYNEVLSKNAQNKNDLVDANLKIMLSDYELGKYDEAIDIAEKILNSEQVNSTAISQASLMKGKSFYQKKDSSSAKVIFESLIKQNKDRFGAEAMYFTAKIKQDKSRYEESNLILDNLNKQFGAEKYWISKSFLMIGDNLILMGEPQQAKATYESIVQYSKYPEVVEEAKLKLKKINDEQKAQRESALPSDTLEIGE